eukprot:14219614-Alexandrium_andersonii.AAC.1
MWPWVLVLGAWPESQCEAICLPVLRETRWQVPLGLWTVFCGSSACGSRHHSVVAIITLLLQVSWWMGFGTCGLGLHMSHQSEQAYTRGLLAL